MKPILQRCLSLTLVFTMTQFASAVDKANGKHKVLFLAGKPSHGYGAHDHLAGCMLLAKSLECLVFQLRTISVRIAIWISTT